MSEKENPTGGGFVPVDGNWFSIEAERRQADALERIATALEVLVVVEVFQGLDSARANMPGCVETLKEVRDFFREARDASGEGRS